MGRVAGKIAIVTGAASGLGAADAARLSEEGATVVLTDINEAAGQKLTATLPRATFLRHDVSMERDWIDVIGKTIDLHGTVDILVNNAGIASVGTIEEVSIEEYRKAASVMSEGTFLGCKHILPVMRAHGGGSIINISSVAALIGYALAPAYSAAKGAIRALSRSVAVQCVDQRNGIRCNTIFPGVHDTPMTAASMQDVSADEPGLDHVRRIGAGKPIDVANLVLFLASEESRHITGAEFVIDYGETAR